MICGLCTFNYARMYIGVTYAPESPKSPVKNWCVNQKWERYRPLNTPPRAVNESHTIDTFINLMEKLKSGDCTCPLG